MKNLIIPVMGIMLMLAGCSKDQDVELVQTQEQKSTSVTESIDVNTSVELILSDDSAIDSTGIAFTSVLSQGDTVFWKVDEESNIVRIEEIIIVESDCGDDLFVDGVIYNEDKTLCYGVISDSAYGKTEYNIVLITTSGDELLIDSVIRIDPH